MKYTIHATLRFKRVIEAKNCVQATEIADLRAVDAAIVNLGWIGIDEIGLELASGETCCDADQKGEV